MAIKWRCTFVDGLNMHFTVGNIYEEDADRSIMCDSGFRMRRCGEASAIDWLCKHWPKNVKFEEVTDMVICKSDLRANDIVRTVNGRYYMCMTGGIYSETSHGGMAFVRLFNHVNGWLDSSEYNDDLTSNYDSEWDIQTVYRPDRVVAFPTSEKLFETDLYYKKVFNRKDETVKEMTVSEISELLGYEVKIVKEDK